MRLQTMIKCEGIEPKDLLIKSRKNEHERVRVFYDLAIPIIEEYKSYFDNILSEGKEGYVSENGEVQKWVGGIDKERAQNALTEMIKHLNSLKK